MGGYVPSSIVAGATINYTTSLKVATIRLLVYILLLGCSLRIPCAD